MTEAAAPTSHGGGIKVTFETASVYLSHELPHVVRDANLRVVAEGRGNHTYRLPAGLYSVEAVSPTGRRTSSIVSVAAGDVAEVTIDDRDQPVTAPDPQGSTADVTVAPPAVTAQVLVPPVAAGRTAAREPSASAVTCSGCGSPVVGGRIFCQRCGAALQPAAPAPGPRGRWWGRLLPGRWQRRNTEGADPDTDDVGSAPGSSVDEAAAESPGMVGSAPTAPAGAVPASPTPPARIGAGSRHRAGLVWQADGALARLRGDDVRLVRTSGCVIHDVHDDQLVFRGDGQLDEPAIAVFEFSDRNVHVSLPVHCGASFPLDAATVTAARAATGSIHVVAGFPPERRVARVIDTMAGNGSIVDADALVRQSSELLLHKYADPPAAAMGALLLHRLGQLDERESWVRNLATDFPWLPDGVALYASILRGGDAEDRAHGLDILLDATTRRPLYTDGLSLMVSLLRRWPGDDRPDERRSRIEALAGYLVTANLDEMCLTCVLTTNRSER